jgi:hypothetical protein
MPPRQNLFEDLRKRVTKARGFVPAEKRATFWFTRYTAELNAWQRRHTRTDYEQLIAEDFSKQLVNPTSAFPGSFYFYYYDPKLKKTLPYYDTFPFTLVLHKNKTSFLGLNFHYLDYENRAKFFDLLYPFREGRTATPDVRDLRMRLDISYAILKSSYKYRAFRPCIKRYLVKHVETPLMKVSAHEWDVALFLPVERFKKQSKQTVWAESKRRI